MWSFHNRRCRELGRARWHRDLVAVLGVCAAAISAHAADGLRLERVITLANVVGRIDHMAVDAEHARLYVAALGNNSLEIINLAAGKVVHSITGLHEPQGVALLNNEQLLAIANGDDGTCRFFDLKSLSPNITIALRTDADNVRYEAIARRLYVGFGSGAIAVVNSTTRQHETDIALAGHPESFQLETNGPRLFVNVPTAKHIAVLDRMRAKIIATWPVENAEANFPMAIDEKSNRLFVGCRKPAVVLVYDIKTGQVVSRFSTVGDADDMFFDALDQRLYVIGGEGYVGVYHAMSGDRYPEVAKVATRPGARTGMFAPQLRRLFVAVPRHESQAAEIREYSVVP